MIGDTLAKLYGSILEHELSKWVEEEIRAPRETGFTRGSLL